MFPVLPLSLFLQKEPGIGQRFRSAGQLLYRLVLVHADESRLHSEKIFRRPSTSSCDSLEGFLFGFAEGS